MALKDEDREGLVNALKVSFVLYVCVDLLYVFDSQNKLQNLAGQHSDVLENLTPKIRRRVEVLREIQIDTVSSCEHEPVCLKRLTKAYHMIDEDEPLLEKAIGREIDWYPGKCSTQKILKKKPKKGMPSQSPKLKIVKASSTSSILPKFLMMITRIEYAEELQNLMEQDYDIGFVFFLTFNSKGGRPQLHDGQQGERPPDCKQQ
ncbi:hypothetical protein F2Q68_00021898 [Brassica cretica]|uniref:Uncharacterized protein n=1 Tax=Brassica cretica TaxID=69181 RepID=A0A8S9G0D4_BRACR|nr:hypothetical protein F2Q68_00021898 [Brassica cretica]